MKKGLLVFFFLLNLPIWASNQKTNLVVGITISHFYPEWLLIYQDELSEYGFKRLVKQGQKMMADYRYVYSQTGVDQATIYSGLLPSEHGIIDHQWYDRLKGKRQGNVVDENWQLIGDVGVGLSPNRLQVMTLGSTMKMNNVYSKVYSIGVNGEESVLSGGSCADMAFWLSENTGEWISSDYYASSLPGWVLSHNITMNVDSLIRKGWLALENEDANRTSMKLKKRIGLNSRFYYDLAQAKRKYDTYRILKATPFVNSMVMDLALQLLKQEQLGKDQDADLLTLNFSCLDYMNRDFDVNAREFQDVVLRLDKEFERLFKELDQQVGEGNYTIFLTFSEARELLPEELQKMRISADYFGMYKAVALLKSFLNLIYGEGDWVLDFDATQIYLDRDLIERKKLLLKEVQDKVADFLIDFEGVARVLTANSLSHNTSSSGMEMLCQNAFSQKRSGDVLVLLQPTWIPMLKDREDSYARYSKRNKVPFYLYGAGMSKELPREGEMTSVLPLLCDILGIPVPYSVFR